ISQIRGHKTPPPAATPLSMNRVIDPQIKRVKHIKQKISQLHNTTVHNRLSLQKKVRPSEN
ncbi:MAG: hypothetical protein N4A65_15205, partial [Cohaesibacter sp.]|nr:hypothetical protein [Cohaesibacter sp.]